MDNAQGRQLAESLGSFLERAMASSKGKPSAKSVTKFDCTSTPEVSVERYAKYLFDNFRCSGESFVLAAAYLDRILKGPELELRPLSAHRLLLTSLLTAAKFHEDIYYTNSYYAKVGGVSLREMNSLEGIFLKAIGWRLHVLPDAFESYRRKVLGLPEPVPVQPLSRTNSFSGHRRAATPSRVHRTTTPSRRPGAASLPRSRQPAAARPAPRRPVAQKRSGPLRRGDRYRTSRRFHAKAQKRRSPPRRMPAAPTKKAATATALVGRLFRRSAVGVLNKFVRRVQPARRCAL